MRVAALFGLALSSLAVAAGCGDSAPPAASSEPPFVAYPPGFAGFRAWESFSDPTDPIATSPHLAGTRTEYLNHHPPHGSAEFPVGTIIVKEVGDGPIPFRTVFAMVKRGGGYNAQGATNWEWFELVNDTDRTVTIRWRGIGPPPGEAYGTDPTGGCNSCHAGSRANDFVQSTAVRLGAL